VVLQATAELRPEERRRRIMKTWTMIGLVLAGLASAGPALAADQPPMNGFDQAFYNCQGDHNFLVTYDSDTPTAATLTTNNDNKTYALKRESADKGVAFTGDGAKFWTDGSGVTVAGTAISFQACKRKGG
jgi:hypothetical protein